MIEGNAVIGRGFIDDSYGGGIYSIGSQLEVSNTVIKNNISRGDSTRYNSSNVGGGIYSEESALYLTNCLVYDNLAASYYAPSEYYSCSGIYSQESNLQIVNCTLSNSKYYFSGYLLYLKENEECTLTNTILLDWDDSDYDDIDNISFSAITKPAHGEGNIVVSSLSVGFITGPWGEYYLSNEASGQPFTSPCVDTGNSNPPIDFDYQWMTTRTDGVFDIDRIDMGYHYPPHVQFELVIEPEKDSFQDGDKINVTADLITAPYGGDMLVDLYFVLIDPKDNIYSYPEWEMGIKPVLENFPLPPNLSFNDIQLLDLNIPNSLPPIETSGKFTFAIGAFKAGTSDPVSNIAVNFFSVEPLFLQISWWFDTLDSSFGQSAAGDIDNDGKLEIVFGCYRNDGNVYALNAEDGLLLWKYNTHSPGAEGCNDVAPIIYDIMEVIVPSSCNPTTFCFNGLTGDLKWQTPTAGSDSPPTIADIDNDGKPEILHGGFDGHVMCLNGEDGSVSWSLAVNENSWIQTAPTIVDVDGNGQLDFIVGTWAFSDYTNKVYAYNGEDCSLIWSKEIPDVMYHGTAVSDLDSDGKPELVIGAYDGKLYVLNGEDGSIAWEYQASYFIGAPVVIADLNKNPDCEIIFCDAYGVGVLTNTGDLLWYYTITDNSSAFRGVATADINGDDTLDVVFGTGKGRVIVLSGSDGSEIWRLDLAAHYGNTFDFDHSPIIADFDNDGTIDIFLVGGHTKYPDFENNYGRDYMISAGIGEGPFWLMFQHDIRRQSSTCGVL